MRKQSIIVLLLLALLIGSGASAEAPFALSLFQPAATVTPAPEYPKIGYTTQASVNVRQKPASNAKVVRQIKKGTEVTVNSLESVKGVDWYNVTLQSGKTGYIRADLMAIGQTITEALAVGSAVATPTPEAKASGSGSYIGNKNSKVFHRSSCGSLPKSKNRVYFKSRAAATGAGYKPCSKCRP